MVYDHKGHFIRPELAIDTNHYIKLRTSAARYAVPLADYLTNHEPHLLA